MSSDGDLSGPAKPWSKEQALARSGKRYHRQKAGAARWAEIAARKQGRCRVTDEPPPNELHHLIPRSQGGADSEANLVPLSPEAHALVEARDPDACRLLAESLTDAEYAYVIEHYGEGFFERRLGVKYERG